MGGCIDIQIFNFLSARKLFLFEFCIPEVECSREVMYVIVSDSFSSIMSANIRLKAEAKFAVPRNMEPEPLH